MPRLTDEAKDCINTLKDVMSNRQLRDYLEEKGYGKYSQGAVGRQKKKMIEHLENFETAERMSDTLDTSENIQTLEDRKEKIVGIVPDPDEMYLIPKVERKIHTDLNFNLFMEKLEASSSYTSNHLKEKLNVGGKKRKINKERVIRIIRDVLDVLQE